MAADFFAVRVGFFAAVELFLLCLVLVAFLGAVDLVLATFLGAVVLLMILIVAHGRAESGVCPQTKLC